MRTLLIIEDNTDIREGTVELLELAGFRVLSAPEGNTGLELIHKCKPDLVFCDVLMPGLSGYDVLTSIRRTVEFQDLPFYFISALAEPIDERRGLELGAMGYLKKPYTEDDLLNSINREFSSPGQHT
ncbi:response regulator [Spirosoma sp. KCTC 42546]|uniref:response regulator n=1 Tax=Spirosoma sp. KCTC 42546 TaxID=2520506 RepID=UPI0011595A8E|nr:response regulator [Spirosoma sp. KCTC 42546]QDK77248.1 response regulator [Spirosoma sp. KCTC 42546]